MELKITSSQILKVLYVLSWIIFIGLCIETGGFLFNAIATLALGLEKSAILWKEVDLSNLYQFDSGYFVVQTFVMVIVGLLRCIVFYLILKILGDKKFDFSQPFNLMLKRFLLNVSYLSLGIGFFSIMGAKYAQWFTEQGVEMPQLQDMRLAGADVWIFMGITLFVIAQIFKRGMEIQQENELTI